LTLLREALAEEYPLVTSEQAMNVNIGPQGISSAPIEVLRFTTLDKAWAAILTGESVALEVRRYTEIGDFASRYASILSLVDLHLKPRFQVRFGLRYVNEFRHAKGDTFGAWAELLNAELLNVGALNVLGGTVRQTVSEIRTQQPDGDLVLRHGFLEGTTVPPVAGVQPKQGPFYLLDLDYFNETSGKFDPTPLDRLVSYNDRLHDVFRWTIGEGPIYQHLRDQV